MSCLYLFKVDVSGSLSGEDIAFIYPDLKTALVGTFIHGQLLIGQTCFVRSIANEDSLLCPTFTLPAGTNSITFNFFVKMPEKWLH